MHPLFPQNLQGGEVMTHLFDCLLLPLFFFSWLDVMEGLDLLLLSGGMGLLLCHFFPLP